MTPHEELVEFESWVIESFERSAPLENTRELVAAGDRGDRSLQTALAELGLLGLLVPESAGGLDASPLMVQSFLRAAGAALIPTGLLSGCVLAPFLLRAAAGEDELLAAIAGGSRRIAWADAEGQEPMQWEDGKISGVAVRVLDADIADEFIVTIDAATTPSLYIVDAEHAVVDKREPLDPTRPALSVTFDHAPARRLQVDDVEHLVTQSRLLLMLGLAAESAGEAKASLDRTVSYAKIREQFGRTIGSFQAVKHMSADMFVAAEGAAAGVELAARRWEEQGELDQFEVLAVSTFAFRAARTNADSMMQIRGGLAFTWEDDSHWYLKRATSTPLIAPAVNDTAVADLALTGDFDIVHRLFSA